MRTICLKYRVLPTKAQESALNRTLETCREVYNSLVNERTAVYETRNETLALYAQQAAIGKWKAIHPELSDVHSQVLQNVALR
ncbi:helix-turn-helix domain-containing protein, partial [Armatimonas sp.]|uniref:helix-turn-helix domain-containing protein n=1 Tax=Armatimonas sp. TaxID=1872638 RepID=UPI0037536FA0